MRGRHTVVGVVLVGAVTVGLADRVQATPPPPNPSDGEMAAAGAQVAGGLGQVGALINEVAAADEQLSRLDDELAARREAVNKALVDLENARSVADEATLKVDTSKRAVEISGGDIERAQQNFTKYAAKMYAGGGDGIALASVVRATDARDALDRSRLVALMAKKQRAVLDGLQRARVEQANRHSAARAAKNAAVAAAADAERKRGEAERGIAAAQAAAEAQAARKAEIESRRTAAQTELDAARVTVDGLADQRATFVAWDSNQRVQAAVMESARRAALEAARRVAADQASRDRAADLANGRRPHTLAVSPGQGDDEMVPESNRTGWVAPPKPSGNAAIESVIDRAMSQMGVIYAWGGGNAKGPTKGIRDGGVADRYGDFKKIGFDCSGLMLYAFAGVGILLPHYSGYQYNAGKRVPLSQRKRGDMLFWGRNGSRHVALYLGNGQMLEAPQSGDVVKISPVRFNGIMPNAVRLIPS